MTKRSKSLTSKMVSIIMKEDIASLMAKVEELEGVIHHCWLYAGYRDCGSNKMTATEKECYLGAVRDVADRIDKQSN